MLFLEETYLEVELFDEDSSTQAWGKWKFWLCPVPRLFRRGGRRQPHINCPLTTNPINHINLENKLNPSRGRGIPGESTSHPDSRNSA